MKLININNQSIKGCTMKTLLSLLVFSALLFIGCMDNSSELTSPDVQILQKSNSPEWVEVPAYLGLGFGVETPYSASKLIKGKKGGEIKLKVKIKRPGHEFGDFEIKAKVKVEKHSFPDNEERLFTITMDAEYAYLNICPSPNTLYKHIKVDFEIKGIDVSYINPDTFNFFYVGDINEMLETSKVELTVDYNRHKIKVKKAVINPTTTGGTPPGIRYAFVR
jgi:hypothetical protein